MLFAVHNVIKDPPFSHLDLVTCRNLLIYLNRTAQERVMEVLHFALKPGGYLFLGSSESIDDAADLYVPSTKDPHFPEPRRRGARPTVPGADPTFVSGCNGTGRAVARRAGKRTNASPADLHQRLLEQYAPPSIVVNQEHDIVHMSERAGRYLQFSGGEPSHNLLKAIRPELRLELRTALYQAAQKRTNVEAPAW